MREERTLGWLDAVPPVPRQVLAVGTLVLVLGASLTLGLLGLEPVVFDAVALGLVVVLAGAWGIAYVRWAEPELKARRAAREAEAERHHRVRGVLVGGALRDRRGGLDALATRDPSFSMPAFLDRARRLFELQQAEAGLCASVRPLAVQRSARRTTCRVRLDLAGADGRRHAQLLVLSRPAEALSLPPDALADTARDATRDDWTLDAVVPLDAPAPPLPEPMEDLSAATRALKARDPDLDLEAEAERVRDVLRAVAAGDLATATSRATPLGAQGLTALPRAEVDPEADLVWIEIDEDGWFERLALRVGAVHVGLLRPVGAAEAPFEIWRVLCAGEAP